MLGILNIDKPKGWSSFDVIRFLKRLFNEKKVESVIHTGDITKARSLEKFSSLNCDFFAVYGNNDRNEFGLDKVAIDCNFIIQDPPMTLDRYDRKIAPTAPTPADSVGVANPPNIEPRTAIIKIKGGNKALNTFL